VAAFDNIQTPSVGFGSGVREFIDATTTLLASHGASFIWRATTGITAIRVSLLVEPSPTRYFRHVLVLVVILRPILLL
jgi:hypothetical protein